jgi:glycosyltransferase involved in cell wall biosynthesis
VSGTALVIPCYNEARRLDAPSFAAFLARDPDVRLVLVDDGSTDDTRKLLEAFAAEHPGRAEVLGLDVNRGKAEAVRLGMLRAFDGAPAYAGFWDGDLSTPLEQVPEFRAVLAAQPEIQLVTGARVQLLGRSIHRSPLRHYLGRLAATAIALVLRIPVYDTQCGAKLLRGGPESAALFAEPFVTRWLFDVELIARLGRRRVATGGAAYAIHEFPLAEWRDVPGSKIRPKDYVRGIRDLARIALRYGWR